MIAIPVAQLTTRNLRYPRDRGFHASTSSHHPTIEPLSLSWYSAARVACIHTTRSTRYYWLLARVEVVLPS